ncbi:Hypothetical protein chromosome condensation (RCC1) and BTB (POZ) domain containing protein [Nesidiocoris tenuis]|uniref:BTB domain-containing protein n=1 Tax=Nesidiocoris tenuis TaxID=355587 RepID=A0ABN7A6T5_9HEMI|nr:Hypothetical protein chromosome condensation (RCC1) and BTB (POZ) domain containing protein [Nesidiocoris tenuis]
MAEGDRSESDTNKSLQDGMAITTYIPMDLDGWPFLSMSAKLVKHKQQQIELLHIFGDSDELLSALFITSDDFVYGVGRNDFGRLGIGLENTDDISEPHEVDILSGKRVVCFASGAMHVLALTEAGDVYSWGLNTLGPLGNGTILNRSSPGHVLLPRHIKIKAIAARNNYSLAVSTDNEVFHWGDKLFTECSVQNMPIRFLSFNDGISVKQIACACSHAALLTSDGEVRVWADISVPDNDSWEPRIVTTAEHKNIVSIACSWQFTVALSESGSVYIFRIAWYSADEYVYLNSDDPILKDQTILEIAGTSYFCSPLIFRTSNDKYLRYLPPYTEGPRRIDGERNIQSAFNSFATPQMFRTRPDAVDVFEIQGPLRRISDLYNKKELSDITVRLRDGEIYVHKLVLVTYCQHFKSMLLGSWAEHNATQVLDMERYNPQAYRAFLKYVYSGCLELRSGDDLIDLYDIAKSYMEDELLDMCSKMIVTILKPTNAASLYAKAHQHNFEDLMQIIANFSGGILRQVILSEAFSSVEPKIAKTLVIEAVKATKTSELKCNHCG